MIGGRELSLRAAGRRAGLLILGVAALSAGLAGPGRAFVDLDGNGLDDEAEILLAERFRPSLVFPTEGTAVRPCPVSILAGGADLTADHLWARVVNAAGQIVTVAQTTDSGWNPPPTFAAPHFDYSSRGWDGGAISYVGSPPGAAYSIYYIRLHADYGGPSIRCPEDWRELYRDGSAEHPPGAELPPTTYVHLLLDQGVPVVQYWFFFPFNDWSNDHEGDWEHLHVRVTSDQPEEARIDQVCFYFHGFHQVRDAVLLAVADETHPVVWMGGPADWSCPPCDESDCGPGGEEGADSHGCYPAPGSWANVGAYVPGCGRADEEIGRCGAPLHWSDLSVEILPDPEAIDFGERPGMAWHGARIPMGAPFAPSYCDDECAFFSDFPLTQWLVGDCGNRAPDGPSHHAAWGAFAGGSVEGAYSGGPSLPQPGPLSVPEEFPSLEAAARCALPGDTIWVAPGCYQENVLLPGGITLLSTDGEETTLWQAPSFGRCAKTREEGAGVRIGDVGHGFHFTGGGPVHPIELVALGAQGESVLAGNRFSGTVLFQALRLFGGAGPVYIERNRFSTFVRAIYAPVGPDAIIVIGGARERANDFALPGSGSTIELLGEECPVIEAELNYWGSLDEGEITAGFAGAAEQIRFRPWTDAGHEGVYTSTPSALLSGEEEARGIAWAVHPNPAAGTIAVRLRNGREQRMRLRLFDTRGRERASSAELAFRPGNHSVEIPVGDLPSGVYFLLLQENGEGRGAGRKVVLVK